MWWATSITWSVFEKARSDRIHAVQERASTGNLRRKTRWLWSLQAFSDTLLLSLAEPMIGGRPTGARCSRYSRLPRRSLAMQRPIGSPFGPMSVRHSDFARIAAGAGAIPAVPTDRRAPTSGGSRARPYPPGERVSPPADFGETPCWTVASPVEVLYLRGNYWKMPWGEPPIRAGLALDVGRVTDFLTSFLF